jgi:transcriptional regulator with XRE-family HTH domain
VATRNLKIQSPKSASEIDWQIGTRIRQARITKGITQNDLAKMLNISFQQIQKYEKGTNRVNPRSLVTIAKALEVDPNYLVGWSKSVDMRQVELHSATLKTAVLLDRLSTDARSLLMMLANAMIRTGFGAEQ